MPQLNDALSLIDRAIKVADGLKNVDQKEALLAVKAELVRTEEENLKLKAENAELREKAKIKEEVYPRNNAYWKKDQEGKEDGPFCYACLDKDGALRRMAIQHQGYATCPSCKYSASVYPQLEQKSQLTRGSDMNDGFNL